MKLSQAIAIGAAQTKPTYGKFFTLDFEGNLCACALGCAIYALNPEKPIEWYLDVATDFDKALESFPELGEMSISGFTLREKIVNSNDYEGGNREEIAARLARKGF